MRWGWGMEAMILEGFLIMESRILEGFSMMESRILRGFPSLRDAGILFSRMLPAKALQTLSLPASLHHQQPRSPCGSGLGQERLRAPNQLSSHHFQPGTSRYNSPPGTDANLCSGAKNPLRSILGGSIPAARG